MQWGTPPRHFYEDVSLHKIRPDCRNFAQPAAIIVEIQVTRAETTPVLNEIKLLAAQRVKGVRDLYSADFFCRNGCSREGI